MEGLSEDDVERVIDIFSSLSGHTHFLILYTQSQSNEVLFLKSAVSNGLLTFAMSQ